MKLKQLLKIGIERDTPHNGNVWERQEEIHLEIMEFLEDDNTLTTTDYEIMSREFAIKHFGDYIVDEMVIVQSDIEDKPILRYCVYEKGKDESD